MEWNGQTTNIQFLCALNVEQLYDPTSPGISTGLPLVTENCEHVDHTDKVDKVPCIYRKL